MIGLLGPTIIVVIFFILVAMMTSASIYKSSAQRINFDPWLSWRDKPDYFFKALSWSVRSPLIGGLVGAILAICLNDHKGNIISASFYAGLAVGLFIYFVFGRDKKLWIRRLLPFGVARSELKFVGHRSH